MPAPNRTTNEQIVAAARGILDARGIEALTMQAVANDVGVRAPSLYKRVQSRDQLIGLVVESSVLELATRLDAAAARSDDAPVDSLIALARVMREFAHRHPHRFMLIFASCSPAVRPSADVLAASSAAILRVAERLAGRNDALDAARTVTAWALGFLTMELSGAFQLGGDPATAFEYGALAIARAIQAESEFSATRPSTWSGVHARQRCRAGRRATSIRRSRTYEGCVQRCSPFVPLQTRPRDAIAPPG